jgi:outer membrane receptor protein involved in Fe transport
LFFDSDLTYAYARITDEPEDAQFIPLAPKLTYTGGLSLQDEKFSGGIHWRFLGDRPATEDNQIIAKGYFITDLNLNYTIDKVTFGFVIENLFDSEWNETQFATESRLSFEPSSVEEIHFTPGTPFYIKGTIQYAF